MWGCFDAAAGVVNAVGLREPQLELTLPCFMDAGHVPTRLREGMGAFGRSPQPQRPSSRLSCMCPTASSTNTHPCMCKRVHAAPHHTCAPPISALSSSARASRSCCSRCRLRCCTSRASSSCRWFNWHCVRVPWMQLGGTHSRALLCVGTGRGGAERVPWTRCGQGVHHDANATGHRSLPQPHTQPPRSPAICTW